MTGIREAAMSQEKPKYQPAQSYSTRKTDFHDDMYNPSKEDLKDYDRFMNDSEIQEYNAKKKNQITITIYIPREEIEDVLEKYYVNYDWEPVENEAIQIGYKRLEELLEKNFIFNYDIEFSSMEGLDEVELTATLTKITK